MNPRLPSPRRTLTADEYVDGVLAGHIPTLARAITLIESHSPRHRAQAREVLDRLVPRSGGAHRVGITGVPGVGKSTFIEALGTHLTELGHRVAVLAVDPTSSRTGGSILGDKTRMESLARNPAAFIRPSPTGGTLGGVASRTRETMLLCEAAGFDVVLVETVGVGQSELVVADITDFFLVLMLAGAGDELQGIKRGLMELADMLAVNKADGDNALPAQRAASTYRAALRLLRPPAHPGADGVGAGAWHPSVVTCSALHNDGIDAVWTEIQAHRVQLEASGAWQQTRREQQHRWLWRMVDDQLRTALHEHEGVKAKLGALEKAVDEGAMSPTVAAEAVVGAFLGRG